MRVHRGAGRPPSAISLMLVVLALLSTLFSTASAVSAAADHALSAPVLRFPMEGGGHHTVCGVGCTTTPAFEGATTLNNEYSNDELLRAQVREVSSTLNIPARSWYGPSGWFNGTSLGPWKGGQLQTVELRVGRANASCVTVYGGRVDAAGPGMVYISTDNGTTWGNGLQAEWFESVAVAFGLRPYIVGQEEDASLLVWSDTTAAPIAEITMELPFCEPARTQKWTVVARPRAVLRFAFDHMPELINQDVKVVVKLSTGHSFTKLRRFMRAPPLSNSSSALPVQVDHAARGLRVDGRPYVGIGWYLDGMSGVESGRGFATFDNMTDYLAHAQAPVGVNQGMIYRMFTYPPERQLHVLDQLAASGFKVMYEVGQQLSDCGDPIQAELRGMRGLCFNDSTKLAWLKDVIHLVKHHPALLGYYSTTTTFSFPLFDSLGDEDCFRRSRFVTC